MSEIAVFYKESGAALAKMMRVRAKARSDKRVARVRIRSSAISWFAFSSYFLSFTCFVAKLRLPRLGIAGIGRR
jgi:hypothetical protein